MNKRTFFLCVIVSSLILLSGINHIVHGESGKSREPRLWPEIEPFQSGYLQVSDLHRVYYEVSGNTQGKPIFIIHGGPGGESFPEMRQWADPKKFMIVLHDQRGAGKSRPFGETRENTTQNLVSDIERLRKKLNVNQIMLVGRSWGTTLALLYAETYPKNVSGMVLCAVFTGTKNEIDHIFHGGVSPFFPKTYRDFLNALPNPAARPLPAYLYRLLHKGDKKTKRKIAKAWGRYTIKISKLEIRREKIEEILKSYDPFLNAYFESYYMANSAFIAEGQILRDAGKIAHIPTVIINGRYDVICPLKTAYRLHKALPKSKLVIVPKAGHSGSDPGIQEAVLEAVDLF